SDAYFASPLAQGTPGKQCGLAATGDYQPSLRSPWLAAIEQEGADVSTKMQASIMAFQFYDKLSQRLSHVNHALEALGELVGDQGRLYNPSEWTGLQGKIRSRYSMREEQEMFDALLSGATIEEALQMGIAAMHEAEDDDIELF
ncbi:MAG: hypothetical protein JMN26_05145, partial [gamma proteobacterium endosymbiont of Lamellibrachia anaximandri]|nr:hypothetical protein [gamma proteobacterium endosymbiont of Lamellibrachia anaximandri]